MRLFVVCCGFLFLISCEGADVTADKKDVEILEANAVAETQYTDKVKEENKTLKLAASKKENTTASYQVIEWDALIPKAQLDALLNPPEYITDVVDGSLEDQFANTIQRAVNQDKNNENTYEQALISTDIIESMNGKFVEVPGFVVPVGFGDEQVITSFFLVPYFGACLHMPPPPPNQIIYVETDQGFVLETLYDPVIISGKLSTELFEDQIATSAYTMQMHKMKMYYENEPSYQ